MAIDLWQKIKNVATESLPHKHCIRPCKKKMIAKPCVTLIGLIVRDSVCYEFVWDCSRRVHITFIVELNLSENEYAQQSEPAGGSQERTHDVKRFTVQTRNQLKYTLLVNINVLSLLLWNYGSKTAQWDAVHKGWKSLAYSVRLHFIVLTIQHQTIQ